MTSRTMDQAIDALRRLSQERQQELAELICHLASDASEAVDPADLPAVLEGLEQARQRKFATPERIATALGLPRA